VTLLGFELPAIEDEWGIGQVIELCSLRIQFCDRFPWISFDAVLAKEKLQVIAVRADDCLSEAGGFVTVSPVECGFEDDLLRRVTLRFVEASGRLWFAKDVRHAVIADAVARTEVRVRVVVERAPPDAAGILWIRRKLVVNARMSQHVLLNPFHLIDRLRRICVADKFRIQVSRMIWRFQRETEVVHCKNIFEEFGRLEVSDAARLPRRIELVCERVGAYIEVVIVLRLVDAHAPQNDAGMIPVAANHARNVVDGNVLPRYVADMLPAGYFFEHEQSHFVACVEKVPRLRIVRRAHDVAVHHVAEDIRVAALATSRHCLSHERKCLMAVKSA